jgi:hypothetical protein
VSFAEEFWWVITMAAVVWYLTVTVYVAFRGALDIKHMLRKLAEEHVDPDAPVSLKE